MYGCVIQPHKTAANSTSGQLSQAATTMAFMLPSPEAGPQEGSPDTSHFRYLDSPRVSPGPKWLPQQHPALPRPVASAAPVPGRTRCHRRVPAGEMLGLYLPATLSSLLRGQYVDIAAWEKIAENN